MKKVESVETPSDEKTNWKAQVFLSHRTWEATIVEQVPDSHIIWQSKGAKGHVDGAVTFTELGRNLTRVLLVMEYYPQGLFEKTGNIWRAVGRRARLEFQHFARHAMTNAILRQEEIEGWRGEIRDSEVVKTHEEALAEEEEREDQEWDESRAKMSEDGKTRPPRPTNTKMRPTRAKTTPPRPTKTKMTPPRPKTNTKMRPTRAKMTPTRVKTRSPPRPTNTKMTPTRAKTRPPSPEPDETEPETAATQRQGARQEAGTGPLGRASPVSVTSCATHLQDPRHRHPPTGR